MATGKTTKPAGAPAAQADAVMAYIGPTIYGVVRQGTVLKGGLPKELKEHMAHVKQLRALLVPLSRFAQAWKDVNERGTAEHSLYQSALQTLYPEPMTMEVDDNG